MMNIESIQAFYLHFHSAMQVSLLYSPMLDTWAARHSTRHQHFTLPASNDDDRMEAIMSSKTAHPKRIGLLSLLLFSSFCFICGIIGLSTLLLYQRQHFSIFPYCLSPYLPSNVKIFFFLFLSDGD